ncbi:hypothetical protein CSC70_03835 [Pseudoxanthomonas kalamensis DSM 18571]|uniref:hypothetical protein n=1 Tax=Pseudoxanthomonas kalamensis TaxID=289483 RepID=UPI0013912E00|nr:hypothetical protein [Pseudoxanthomonas kalamensis]KAF1711068.1 hypothetical protein CSC70_03835 [Pseudoxanthomonas kalamensis DSM 18571]
MTDVDLTAPEVQAAIDAAVQKATAPLLAKRDELLGEVKKLRKQTEIDPADLEKVESERDDLKAKLADATKALSKATKAAEDATKQAAETDAAYRKSLADTALTEALTKAGVTNPVHLKAVKALLGGAVSVADDNGTQVVKAGDKALGDFITEWAGTDEGKHFVINGASGGGAPGSQGGGGGEQLKRSSMSHVQKAEYVSKHGQDAFMKLPD